MIISASRRTDIPAFYAQWFMNRIRAGYCLVPNPFNPKQVSRIPLMPEDVHVFVFWTRYPAPLFPFLDELDARGYRYYFLYTLMNNPRALDPKKPSHERSLSTFQTLSRRIGKHRVVWRYDPIVFTRVTDPAFHAETYQRIAEALKGYTSRSVISTMDMYRKIKGRLGRLENEGIGIIEPPMEVVGNLLGSMARSAKRNEMDIQSCAETPVFNAHGIPPGKCIDDQLIRKAFHLEATSRKDPSQRHLCGCVASRDIGMYDTCRFGCVYCYANASFDHAKNRRPHHNPDSPFLGGQR